MTPDNYTCSILVKGLSRESTPHRGEGLFGNSSRWSEVVYFLLEGNTVQHCA